MHPIVTSQHPSRTRPLLRTLIASTTVAALALSGAVFGLPAPAQAKESFSAPQNQQVFSSPSGSQFAVPIGVTVVYVGLRGGDGGNAARTVPAGRGDNMVVRLDVRPGDLLTVYAGKSATGKTADQRDGGLGYVAGGTGGTGSKDGKNAGGGGGAAAVLVNGTVAAVAAGGGGHGGNGGFGIFGAHGDGGVGGGLAHGIRTTGTTGGGSHPGSGGGVGTRQTGPGGEGSNAENLSAGGGGGGGGGGWPSGTGGNGGRRSSFITPGNSGGGGGAAGQSAINGLVRGATRVTAAETDPTNFAQYRGPVAEPGTVKIVIPTTTTLTTLVPSTVEAGTPAVPAFQARSSDGKLFGGRVRLSLDYMNIGTFGSNRPTYSAEAGTTFGPTTWDLTPLSAGTHVYRATFESGPNTGDYAYPEEAASSTVAVRALPPITGTVEVIGTPVPLTTLTANTSGLTAPAPLGTLTYQWLQNGRPIPGATNAEYIPSEADAGHELSVRVSAGNYWASIQSKPVAVLHKPELTLTAHPSTSTTLDDIEVAATLTSPMLPADGNNIELRLDGIPVDTDTTRGTLATFTLTGIAPGAHTLTAHYAGNGSNLPVESIAVPVLVERAPQSITLDGMRDEYEVGQTFMVSTSGGSGVGEVTYESSDASVAEVDSSGTVSVLAEGEFSITATKAADSAYAAATATTTATVVASSGGPTILAKDITGATVTLSGGPFVYTGSPLQPDVASVVLPEGITLEDGDYTVSYGSTNTGAGVGTVTITGQDEFTGQVVRSFIIDPKPITITADDEVMVTGDEAPSLDWDADPALAPGDALTGELDSAGLAQGAAIGTYPITQGSLDLSDPNYEFTFVQGTFVVAPASAVSALDLLVLQIPDPVANLADADLVANATNVLKALSPDELAQLSQGTRDALETAQGQAAGVNQNDLEDGVESASAELSANWNIRLLVTPRTWNGSPGVVSQIAEKLAPSNRAALALYDLSFIDTLTGQVWNPAEPVQVSFTQAPIDGWDKIGVIHELPDGSLESIAATVEDGTVAFEASSFSLYGVTAEFETATGPGTDPGTGPGTGPGTDPGEGGGETPGGGTPGGGSGSGSGQTPPASGLAGGQTPGLASTGSSTDSLLWFAALALLAGAGFAAIAGQRRKAANHLEMGS